MPSQPPTCPTAPSLDGLAIFLAERQRDSERKHGIQGKGRRCEEDEEAPFQSQEKTERVREEVDCSTCAQQSARESPREGRQTSIARHHDSIGLTEQICIQADPMPEDFVFVPRGDPYVTRNCKSRSKDAASTVYIVYDNKERAQLGIRVQKDIYKEVTKTAQQTAQNRRVAVQVRDARDQRKAKIILSETFPSMPDACVEEVLQHAFLKGSGRVGRTATRPEKVKAILAVEAHIRHKYTPYEQLLREGIDRESARESVWELVKAIRDKWAEKDGETT
ncbi:hypothetical protein UA08_08731 [Talaromyces atroroseus]|uniref:DUF2293 domain-containing protein n=1 Tax=Talaromyces atroroseus TaxID=1441469 RepID=A0A225ABA6_TALAT|nr:hypothetical protein UA08_08731 [Talaromyces atroroseus]OKL56043.1 hypothetical protein UA08_08731 [Talaromyces atroroseus]